MLRLLFFALASQTLFTKELPISVNVMYPLPLNSTDQFILQVNTNQNGTLTVINDLPLDMFNQTSFIQLQLDSQILIIQPGHNYFQLSQPSHTFSFVNSSLSKNSNILDYKIHFIVTNQSWNSLTPIDLPFLLGNYFILEITENMKNLNLISYVNTEATMNCFAIFEHLYSGRPENAPSINKLTRNSGAATYLSTPFIKNNKNAHQFIENSSKFEHKIELKNLMPGQFLLFHTYCLDDNAESSFALDLFTGVSYAKRYLTNIDDWISDGTLNFGVQSRTFNSMSIDFFYMVVKLDSKDLLSQNQSIAFDTYSRELYEPYFFPKQNLTVISSNQSTSNTGTIWLDRRSDYILNLRAILRPSSVRLLPLYKQSVLNLMTIDLGYRVLSFSSENYDPSKLGLFLTMLLIVISTAIFWGIFLYLFFLNKFLEKQEIRRSSYNGFFKEGEGMDSSKAVSSQQNRNIENNFEADMLTSNYLRGQEYRSDSQENRFDLTQKSKRQMPETKFLQNSMNSGESNNEFQPANTNFKINTEPGVGHKNRLNSQKDQNLDANKIYSNRLENNIPAYNNALLQGFSKPMSLKNIKSSGALTNSREFRTPNFHNESISKDNDIGTQVDEIEESNIKPNKISDYDNKPKKSDFFKFNEYEDVGPYRSQHKITFGPSNLNPDISEQQTVEHNLDDYEADMNNDHEVTGDRTSTFPDHERADPQVDRYDAFKETEDDQSVGNNKYRTDFNDELISINENFDKSFGGQ